MFDHYDSFVYMYLLIGNGVMTVIGNIAVASNQNPNICMSFSNVNQLGRK